jgi:hypothetical protein
MVMDNYYEPEPDNDWNSEDNIQRSIENCLIQEEMSYKEVAKMLADELKMALAAKAAICWEEPDENSSALIAYKALVGEK